MPINPKDYLNASDAARFLGLSRSTFYRLWENGDFADVEIYRPTVRRPMFKRADLVAWIERHGGKVQEE